MKFRGIEYPDPVLAAEVEPKEVTWLWYPYIPAGSASMVFGPGGSGKSHIVIDIASRVSNGAPFPGQVGEPLPPQEVLILGAEDEADRVLVPRLIKAKADLKKVLMLPKPMTLDSQGLALIKHYIARFAIGIVFIDPLVAYIGGRVDLNRANETRVFTGGLHQIAIDTGTPIVVVHHARKGAEGAEYERMMGSADFSNAVRSVMFTTTAPDGTRLMKHVKANYAALGPTWSYRFGDNGFEWSGIYDDRGVGIATKAARKNEAKEWIETYLAGGPKRATDVERAAEKQGYNHRTLVRAKTGVAESYLDYTNGKGTWYWKLKDVTNEPADIPVMDSRFGDTGEDRTTREIKARTEARNRPANTEVGRRRQELTDVDSLMDEVIGR